MTLPFLFLTFTGCSKDEEESTLSFDRSTIIGTWTITDHEGEIEWYWIAPGGTLTFKTDGTCQTGFTMEDSWKIENGNVATYYQKTLEPMLIYTLLSVNNGEYRVKVRGTLDESNLSRIIKMKKN